MTQVMVNGELVTLSDEEEKKRLEQIKKTKEERAKIRYAKDRRYNYPSIVDQLDKIYHSGIDEWKADIKAVKDKFPKPE